MESPQILCAVCHEIFKFAVVQYCSYESKEIVSRSYMHNMEYLTQTVTGDLMLISVTELKEKLNSMFSNSADLSFKEINLKSRRHLYGAVITVEGLCSKDDLAQSVLNPVLAHDFCDDTPKQALNAILSSVSGSCDMTEFSSEKELISYITSGFAVIALDGCEKMIAVGVQGYAYRGVSEPESEVVQRGVREGFTEPLRVNMSMLRRRIKNPDLVFEQMTVGSQSRTQIMLCYLQHCVSPLLLRKVKERLKDCDLPTVLAFVDEQLEAAGCPMLTQTSIDVAVEEVFINIASYAYELESGTAVVQVTVMDDPLSVEITFIDNGNPYDPLKKEDPDITLPKQKRKKGGLGIFMVKKTMDNVTYEYKDGKNILTITKNLN